MGKITPYTPAENAEIKIERFDTCANQWFVSIECDAGHDVCVAILDKYQLLRAIQDQMDMAEEKLYVDAIKPKSKGDVKNEE